ncbi:hypothetical protein MUU47_11145 [Scandinavium sp. H11S7]|uniref:Terminase small subunit n=1 Tax=Scandinavium hiltneri TaxID=2926519 RepID=A0ABT2E197_9ENTR|nr:hypothetical protein [Scandinavium hiltneri]MCS2161664.1 hypothetical protein [Scandinavium hiltneri]
MAKPDWGELQQRFLSDNAKTGVSPKDWCEAQGLNYATARRYIKRSTAQNAQECAQTKVRSAHCKAITKALPARKGAEDCAEGNNGNSPVTKRAHYNSRPGNQNALKHGGYGRRMLLSDSVTEDAQQLTLDDELFWLRAASLTAAENIGRWQAELETADSESAKYLHDLISSAQKAMHRNTQRIESLEYTKNSIAKLQTDVAYRVAATEKVEMEIDVMKDGDKDNAIVVHNTLPIPGR